jgi:hypothetical protein
VTASESRRRKQLEKKKKKRNGKRHELALKSNMSHAEKVLLRSKAPIMECIMAKTLESQGLGYVIIARRISTGEILLSNFLVDRYCLGVKDCFAQFVYASQYQEMLNGMTERDMEFTRIDAPSARRLVEDAVAFAARYDLNPHPDYRTAQLIFGDIDASAGQQLVEMGRDGKPFYISGPFESERDSMEILRKLGAARGQGGFDHLTQVPRTTAMQLLSESEILSLESSEFDEHDDEDDASEYEFDTDGAGCDSEAA